MGCLLAPADEPLSKPITGTVVCCAPAASGHAAAPSSDMNARRSFDHLVGSGKQRRRDVDPERLGRNQVDDNLLSRSRPCPTPSAPPSLRSRTS